MVSLCYFLFSSMEADGNENSRASRWGQYTNRDAKRDPHKMVPMRYSLGNAIIISESLQSSIISTSFLPPESLVHKMNANKVVGWGNDDRETHSLRSSLDDARNNAVGIR